MNLSTFRRTLAAILLFCAAAAAADTRFVAEIPFDFKVGAIHLAGGLYTVERYSIGASFALELTNRRSGARFHVLLRSEETRQAGTPRMEFHCDTGTCELHSVAIHATELWTIRVPLLRGKYTQRLQAVALHPTTTASSISIAADIR